MIQKGVEKYFLLKIYIYIFKQKTVSKQKNVLTLVYTNCVNK